MIVEPTTLAGLLVVRPERRRDDRGYFARLWCREDMARAGISFAPSQTSASFNRRAGTLRGMHWQASPHGETKLVGVMRGRVFDVAVDLRPGSPTRFRWFGLELDTENGAALLIPPGFAHGFVTLADDTELLYHIDEPYRAELARGARWDDPRLAIAWPRAPAVISERDRAFAPLDEASDLS